MKRRFKVGLTMAPYFVLVLYVAAKGPEWIQRLPHWALWVGFCAFLGTIITTGIALRGGQGATETPQRASSEQYFVTKLVTVITVVMVMVGWASGIVVAVILAMVGRIPWSVPIICAPIFAFMLYGLLKALPNIKSQSSK